MALKSQRDSQDPEHPLVLSRLSKVTTSGQADVYAGLSSTTFSIVQVTVVPLTEAFAPVMVYAVAEL